MISRPWFANGVTRVAATLLEAVELEHLPQLELEVQAIQVQADY
jgi:hypothetical protein